MPFKKLRFLFVKLLYYFCQSLKSHFHHPIIYLNMKSNYLFFLVLLLPLQLVQAQNDTYHDNLLSQLQNDYGLTGGNWVLEPNEITNADNANHYGHSTTRYTTTGQDFSEVINMDVSGAGANPWNSGYSNPNINTIQQGDRILAIVWLRTVTAPSDLGKLSVFGEDDATFFKEFYLTVNLSTTWQRYLIPFEVEDTYPSGDINIGFHLAYQEQVLEMGGLTLINYGTSVELSELPEDLHLENYPGSAPDAPWRAEAASRIEQHRKANINVQVNTTQGIAIPNANVQVEMLQHEYAFGSAVKTRRLANNSQYDAVYESKLLDLDGNGHGFNWVVAENALKWRAWEAGWAGTKAETANAIQWLVNQDMTVRGHVLFWPGWGNMPSDMQNNSNNPTYLTNRISGHLTDILNYPGISENVQEWDIVNEITHVRDVEYALEGTAGYPTGREIYVEVLEQALQENPTIATYFNDYNMLSEGSVIGNDYVLYKSMLQEIIDAGGMIDGIGLQAHMGSHLVAPDTLYAILEDCSDTFGKAIKITEYDQSSIIPDDVAAKYTGDFLTLVFSHPATDGFLMWGFWDGAHYADHAPLFNDDWTPKPALSIFNDLLFNQWWTDETDLTGSNGEVTVRGFKGDYRITVTVDGETQTMDVNLLNDTDLVFEFATPLAVDLLHFTAEGTSESTVALNWTTSMETDSDKFVVERSKDGQNWEQITLVDAKGYSSIPTTYQAFDPLPYVGKSYYRLKLVDVHRQISFAPVQSVFLSSVHAHIYPNPVQKQLIIEGDIQAIGQIALYNVLGQNVWSQIQLVSKNEEVMMVNMSALDAGLYFLKTDLGLFRVCKE